VDVSIPFALPGVGPHVLFPAAAPAYAVTFFASDCYAELYGRRDAQWLVNVAFGMNFVLLALVWVAIWLPALDPAYAGTFRDVLASGTNIVLGSLAAYVLSQNWDVLAFHRIRDYTDGEALWLRNVGSTATSQAIDTVVFILVAFVVAPRLLGIGSASPADVVLGLVVGQYLLKLAIALADTPFVYAVVGYLRRSGRAPSAPA
jgi:uncharacterized integral membrane protein (TIGR00697 family)